MVDRFAKERYLHTKQEYTPSVRVNNWFEGILEEEDEVCEVVEKASGSGLKLNAVNKFLEIALHDVTLTKNIDCFLHDGDSVMICCCGTSSKLRFLAALPSPPYNQGCHEKHFNSPCPVTATLNGSPKGRSVFIIYRKDNRVPNTVPIMYGEHILLYSSPQTGSLKLNSECRSVLKYARRSKHQEVEMVAEASARSYWKIVYKDAKFRMEMEGSYAPANADVIINHVATNRNLALEEDQGIKTIFGTELEVSCHSYIGKHKIECPNNMWQFRTYASEVSAAHDGSCGNPN